MRSVTGFRLCVGCDALRDQDCAFCMSCGEATNSYLYHPSEREEFELLANASRIVSAPIPHVSLTTVSGDPMRATAPMLAGVGL